MPTPGPRILPELSEKLARFASAELRRHGVEIRLNTKVTGAGADYAELNGTDRVLARTVIWAGGITPNAVIKKLDCQHGPHGTVLEQDAQLAATNAHSCDWVLDLIFGRNLALVPAGTAHLSRQSPKQRWQQPNESVGCPA